MITVISAEMVMEMVEGEEETERLKAPLRNGVVY
jgi:hypothetical protein